MKILNIILMALLLFGLQPGVEAKEKTTLEIKYEKKLNNAFLKTGLWITDYDKALAESKKQGKPIFAYFTRSYAP